MSDQKLKQPCLGVEREERKKKQENSNVVHYDRVYRVVRCSESNPMRDLYPDHVQAFQPLGEFLSGGAVRASSQNWPIFTRTVLRPEACVKIPIAHASGC
jgi:hypothetical protein